MIDEFKRVEEFRLDGNSVDSFGGDEEDCFGMMGGLMEYTKRRKRGIGADPRISFQNSIRFPLCCLVCSSFSAFSGSNSSNTSAVLNSFIVTKLS